MKKPIEEKGDGSRAQGKKWIFAKSEWQGGVMSQKVQVQKKKRCKCEWGL